MDPKAPPGVIVTFLAPVSGVGRTAAVANVAWVLAAAGKRVLIIDLSNDGAGTQDYLAPFHSEWVTLSRETLHRLADLTVDEPNIERRRQLGRLIPTQVRRYLLPGTHGRIESIRFSDGDILLSSSDSGLIVRYRSLVRASDYDYVLVDAPADMPEVAIRGASQFCDVAVMCFTIREQAMETAARTTRALRNGPVLTAGPGARVVAVPTLVDDSNPKRIAESRRRLRDIFVPIVADFDADVVEIPYFPLDGYDRRLAVLMDEPETAGSPCGAYHRLTGVITGGEVSTPPAVTLAVRNSYRRALGLPVAEETNTIFIAYSPADRPWADWIGAQLRLAGMRVEKHTGAEDADGPVVVVASRTSAGAVEPSGADVVRVRVGGRAEEGDALDLRHQPDEDGARAVLLTHFDLIPDPRVDTTSGPAYPGGPEPVRPALRLPARNPSFVGRDAALESLRDRLSTGEATRYVLSGPGGVGKSEIAGEYAHRFSRDYEVIWWISAHGRERARHGLRALAERLEVQEEGDPIQSVLTALRTGSVSGRWLLVFDNADDLNDLDGLIPTGDDGDVLITTRSPLRDSTPVGAFDAGESVALLRAQVPALLPEEARTVADAVEHLPFSLRLAAAWLRETAIRLAPRSPAAGEAAAWAVAEFHAQLDRSAVTVAVDDCPPSAAACMTLALRALGEEPLGALTQRLIELCAFLSPEEVGLHLLCSSAMLGELLPGPSGEAVRQDAYAVHQVIWLTVRYGFADVDWVNRARLRTHRLSHALVRAALGEGEAAGLREQVLRVLAAYAPNDADGGINDHLDTYRELQRHLLPSGALESDDPGVRRWIIAQLGYLAVTGDKETLTAALEMAENARARWERRGDGDDALLARLMSRTADLRRALGDDAGALELDDEALGLQRRTLGLTHPRTLISGRGRGGTLRGMGRFAEALAEDQSTLTGFRQAFGEEHPETLLAAHNLAVSAYLTGDQRLAHEIARDTYERRVRLFGPDDHRTLGEVPNLGVYLRDIGRVGDSLRDLTDAWERAKMLGPRRPQLELRILRELAVTLRHTDDVADAYARNDEAYRRYHEMFDESHPQTLACGLSLAIAAQAIANPEAAVDLAGECSRAYDRTLGEAHPFSHVCRLDLGLFLFAVGDLDGALARVHPAREALVAELGEQHPWSVAAAIAHACVLAAMRRPGAAEIEESAFADAGDFLGLDHPYITVLTHNMKIGRNGDATARGYVTIDVPST